MKAIGSGRRGLGALALALAAASILAAAGGAAGSAAKGTVAVSRSTTLGSILVNASGKTLYRFLSDRGTSSACSGACAGIWPPLTIAKTAKPVAGAGVAAAKLGTVKRSDGTVQVTYAGHPLYLYAGDKKAGQAGGQGFESQWYVLAPSGATIKTSLTAASPAGTSSSSSSTSGSTSTRVARAAPAATRTTPTRHSRRGGSRAGRPRTAGTGRRLRPPSGGRRRPAPSAASAAGLSTA